MNPFDLLCYLSYIRLVTKYKKAWIAANPEFVRQNPSAWIPREDWTRIHEQATEEWLDRREAVCLRKIRRAAQKQQKKNELPVHLF